MTADQPALAPGGEDQDPDMHLGGRVVPASEVSCQPLFAVSQILLRDAAEAEHLRREAEIERAEAERAAAEIRLSAERDAQKILAAARAQAEAWHREAEAAGRQAALDRFDGILEGLEREVAAVRTAWIEDVWRSGLTFAAAILDVEFALRPERVGGLVRKALSKIQDDARVTIVVHPDDAVLVEERLTELRDGMAIGCHLRVLAAPDAPPRTVRIESDRGISDASLDVQFAKLTAFVIERLRGEDP